MRQAQDHRPARPGPQPIHRVLLRALCAIALGYAVLVGMIAAGQTALLFPRWAVAPAPALPAAAETLRIDPGDGVVLEGRRVPGRQDETPLLAFGGNAWNTDALAVWLHGVFPDRDVKLENSRRQPNLLCLIRFTLLTLRSPQECRLARWEQIDLAAGTWT